MRVAQLVAVPALVAAVWLYGAGYIVYGDGLGIATCWKHAWSVRNTLVDYQAVVMERLDAGWEGRDMPVPWDVVDDVNACKLVEDPGAWSRDQTIGIVLLGAVGGAVLLLLGRRKRSDERRE